MDLFEYTLNPPTKSAIEMNKNGNGNDDGENGLLIVLGMGTVRIIH